LKAFVSYSFKDSELHLITLLIEQLRKSGYTVETSTANFTYDSDIKICNSGVFIGIITDDSSTIEYVVKEWKIAKKNNINNILIIEEGVKVSDPKNTNYIYFNRNNPKPAIEKLFNIKRKSSNDNNSGDLLGGIIIGGAIIAGVAALIELLSGGNDR
jgi:hypothetical protein